MDASLEMQTKEALRNGAAEIDRLRQDNAMLALKAQAFDTISGLIQLLAPRPSQGYAPDAAWILRKLLADIEKQENAAKSPMAEAAE
jgi:hypothetical protein